TKVSTQISEKVKPVVADKEDDDAEEEEEEEEEKPTEDVYESVPEELANNDTWVLTEEQEIELKERYRTVHGSVDSEATAAPCSDKYPEYLQKLTATNFVKHSQATKAIVRMLTPTTRKDAAALKAYQDNHDSNE